MPMTVRILGAREMDSLLAELGPRVAKRVAGNAMRAGARVIRREARRRVRVRTGALKRSIVVRAGREPGTAVVGFLRPTSRRAHLVEFGTRHSPARPFMRPAIDETANEVIEKIGERMFAGIEREAEKLLRGA